MSDELRTLGRVIAEAGLWRRAALAWMAHSEQQTLVSRRAAEEAHRLAAVASGAPAALRFEGLRELERAAFARVRKAAEGMRAAQCQEVWKVPGMPDRRCFNRTGHEGRHQAEGVWWVTDAAELASGGAPAPAGEGAEPPLGKIANTCSRANVGGDFWAGGGPSDASFLPSCFGAWSAGVPVALCRACSARWARLSVACGRCGGSGVLDAAWGTLCPSCFGSGVEP